jgi:hypothetical protein
MSIFNMIKTNKIGVAFCLMAVSGVALAGGPNPGTGEGEGVSGPAIIGTVEFSNVVGEVTDSGPLYDASFSGNCKGQPTGVQDFLVPVSAYELTEADVDGQRIALGTIELPEGCLDAKGSAFDLLVNTVVKYTPAANSGTDSHSYADVVMLFVLYR